MIRNLEKNFFLQKYLQYILSSSCVLEYSLDVIILDVITVVSVKENIV